MHTFYRFTGLRWFVCGSLFLWACLTPGLAQLPFSEDFEAAPDTAAFGISPGLSFGLPGWEYANTAVACRLRTNAGAGFPHAGNRAITLDRTPNGFVQSSFLTATLDLSAYANSLDLELSFWYQHHGEEAHANDRVWVRGDTNQPFVEVFNLTNPNPPAATYQHITGIDVDAALSGAGQVPGSSFQVRFGQQDNFPANDPSGTDGITFDDVLITGNIPATNDVGVSAIISPQDSCGLTANQTVTVTVTNFGTAAQSNIPVMYTLNGGPMMPAGTVAGPLPGLSATTFSFSADLSALQVHNLTVFTNMNMDAFASNDTSHASILNITPVNVFPYLEDFESIGPGFSTNYANDWIATNMFNNTANPRWEAENSNGGNENSNNTGPFFDHTTFGTPGGMYMYMESSNPAVPGDTAYLTSPCIDLSPLTNPHLQYWFHMYGGGMGELHVDVIDSSGITLDVDTIFGEQQTAGGDPWQSRLVDLNAFAGRLITLRFRGVRGPTFASDMSLDDIRVFNLVSDDAEMVELLSPGPPQNACVLSANEPVTIVVTNQGQNTITSLPATYVLDGTPVTETFTVNLPFAASDTLTFATTADLSGAVSFSMDDYVSLPNDAVLTNDSLLNIPIEFGVTAPFIEDFESLNGGFQFNYPNDWTARNSNNNGQNPRWEAEDATGANENSADTGPFWDHTLFGTPGGVYVYMENSNPAGVGDTAFLTSP
ncbi:MAG: hypothetical protein AAGB22_06875, partial [Bacteroidota bacterium]